MKSKDVNKVESTRGMYIKPDDILWNSYMGQLLRLDLDQESMRLCFGCYRNINSKKRFVFEHAWLEINGIICDPFNNWDLPRKLEEYIYIEFFSLTAEETKSFRAYVEEEKLSRQWTHEYIDSMCMLGYLLYNGEKYDDFAKGMDIIADENYTFIDRESRLRLGFYNNNQKVDHNELAFEKMLIKEPSDETV